MKTIVLSASWGRPSSLTPIGGEVVDDLLAVMNRKRTREDEEDMGEDLEESSPSSLLTPCDKAERKMHSLPNGKHIRLS